MLMSRRYGLRTVVLLDPSGCRPSMETAGRESVAYTGWACSRLRQRRHRSNHTAATIDELMAARQTT